MIEIFFISFLCFTSRLLFMTFPSNDFDVYLWATKLYQTELSFKDKTVANSLNKGIIGVPPLPYIYIAKLPEKYWITICLTLNIVYDFIAVIALYFVCSYLFREVNISSNNALISPAGLCAFLYTTSPIFFVNTSRYNGMGTRSLGNLFCLGYFFFLGVYLITGNYIWIPFCVCFGILIILSSKFALQVYVFFSIGLSLIYLSILPCLIMMSAFLVGLLFPKLGIKSYLKTRFFHFKWYTCELKGRTIDDRNSLTKIAQLPSMLIKNPKRSLKFLFFKVTPFILIYTLPMVPVLFFWAFKDGFYQKIVYSDILFYCFALFLSSFIVFAMTSFKKFLFFGEAERYFEYSLQCLVILFVYFGFQFNNEVVIHFTLIAQISCIFIIVVMLKIEDIDTKFSNTPDNDLRSLLSFLRTKEELKLLCIQTKLSNKLAYHLDNTYKFYFYNIHSMKDGLQHTLDNHVAHHLINPDLSKMKKKYGINIVVLEKKYAKFYENYGYLFSTTSLDKVYENNTYEVFDL